MNPTRTVLQLNANLARKWASVGTSFLPFADAATKELPLGRLLRLSLFQVSVGMATALLVGTLNRVMIVELGVAAWLVALMVSLPLLFAPARALVGFKSDTHRSALGWKRVPYIWFGTLAQFGGLAIMPFALLVLSGDTHGPVWVGHAGAALAFLMVGAGMHTTQTAGLALATDLAPAESRPRVVALMYVMLLLGMALSSIAFSLLLEKFGQLKLVQVVQGAALLTMLMNLVALWKQEARDPSRTRSTEARPQFGPVWKAFVAQGRTLRFLVAVGLGTAAFSMQDVVLEPYGGEILKLPVGATSLLTALLALGGLAAFALAAQQLQRGRDPHRLAATGALLGIVAFAAVIFAAPMDSPTLFRCGVTLIGFGGGLFAVGGLTAAMALEGPGHIGLEGPRHGQVGLAIGAWGAVQATCGGVAVALGGALRDGVASLAHSGALGPGMNTPDVGYSFVYHLEVLLLFATLAAIGPLVRARPPQTPAPAPGRFGLAEFPG